MTIDFATIDQALDGVGLINDGEEVDVLTDYSGRGMYGDKCLGLVCDFREFALFCASLGSFSDDWDWLGNVRVDNMGVRCVFYWPRVQVEVDPGQTTKVRG